MPKKIYIVTGETGGEFQENEWWLVAAYKNKEECIKHVDAANKVTNDFFHRNKKGCGTQIARKAIGTCDNPYDPFSNNALLASTTVSTVSTLVSIDVKSA